MPRAHHVSRADGRNNAVAVAPIALSYGTSARVIACPDEPRLYGHALAMRTTTRRRRGAYGNLCPGARCLARCLVLAACDPAPDRARSRGVRANPDRRRRAVAS